MALSILITLPLLMRKIIGLGAALDPANQQNNNDSAIAKPLYHISLPWQYMPSVATAQRVLLLAEHPESEPL